MKIVIVGCGRVGSTLAENLDAEGHEVIIFDVRTSAFDRLPETFKGAAIRGDGTDEEVLRRGGADGADVFLSLTEGDNRNVMAAQVAMENLAIPQVMAKVNDPVRAAAYAELGLVTLCRTNLMAETIADHLKLPMVLGPGIDVPEFSHAHPHPAPRTREDGRPEEDTDEGPERPASQPGRPAPPAARPAEAPAGKAATTHAAETVKSQRIGFRRWRGQ
jgi:trk system potassium uptake protein TrkA